MERQLERWFEVTDRWAHSKLGFPSIGRLVLLCTRAGSNLLVSITGIPERLLREYEMIFKSGNKGKMMPEVPVSLLQ